MSPEDMQAMTNAEDERLRAALGTRGNQRNDGGWCGCSLPTGCGESFNSLSGFDAHRKSGECLSPADLLAQGWSLNRYGRWIVETRSQPGRPVSKAFSRSARPQPREQLAVAS